MVVVPDDSPNNVILMVIDPVMLSVTYGRPPVQSLNGNITGYMIRYTRLDIITMQSLVTMVTCDILTSVISTGLAAFTEYSLEVAVVNINGTGPFSSVML